MGIIEKTIRFVNNYFDERIVLFDEMIYFRCKCKKDMGIAAIIISILVFALIVNKTPEYIELADGTLERTGE
jgi:hypothetical protein